MITNQSPVLHVICRYVSAMGEQYGNSPLVVAKLISYYYSTGLDSPMSNLDRTARLMSDAMFEAPKAKFMDKMVEMGQLVYEFYYTHR